MAVFAANSAAELNPNDHIVKKVAIFGSEWWLPEVRLNDVSSDVAEL